MRVIGIDPGYDRLGYAVLEGTRSKQNIVVTGCITTDKKLPFSQRLYMLGVELETILDTHTPRALALETLFMNKNVSTVIGVAEARGMVMYVAKKRNIEVFEYAPQSVKVAVTGYGKSEKGQVEEMVRRLLPEMPKGALDDEYDAAAAGICCLSSERF